MLKYHIRNVFNMRKHDAYNLNKISFLEKVLVNKQFIKTNGFKSNSTQQQQQQQLSHRFQSGTSRIKTSDLNITREREYNLFGQIPGIDCFDISNPDNRPVNSPGFSSEIWNTLIGNDSKAIPIGLSPITEKEIREADRSHIKRFGVDTSIPGYYFNSLIGNSTWRVSERFGFLSPKDRTFIKLDVDEQIRLSFRNTSASWPTFQKKNSEIAVNDTKSWLNKFYQYPNLKDLKFNPLWLNPNFISNRFQAKYNNSTRLIDTKIRQIFMQPHRILCVEIKYLHASLNLTKNLMLSTNYPIYAVGLCGSEISEQIKRFRNLLTNSIANSQVKRALYSLDYSKFDSSIPSFFIDWYFTWIKEGLPLTQREKEEFDLLRNYSKHTPVLYDNYLSFQRRGVNSGSLTTNNFDSFVNCSLFYALEFICTNSSLVNWVRKGKDIEKGLRKFCTIDDIQNFYSSGRRDFITMGDDGLCLLSNTELIVFQKLCKYIGMDVSTKHVCNTSTEDIFFLGRFWNENNEPFQSEEYMLSHCLYREKRYNKFSLGIDISEELEPIRIISICCSLSNGIGFIYKYFKDYDKLWNLLSKRTSIPLLKDVYPFEGIKEIDLSLIFDWRNLS